MPCCRICGEEKPIAEFRYISHFTKYKKQKVIWCRDCQRLWVDSKRQEEYAAKYLSSGSFTVSFQ